MVTPRRSGSQPGDNQRDRQARKPDYAMHTPPRKTRSSTSHGRASDSSPATGPPQRGPLPARRRSTKHWLIVGGVLACCALVLAIAAWDVFRSSGSLESDRIAVNSSRRRDRATPAPRDDRRPRAGVVTSGAEDAALVDDDGQTLWESPTAGEPLDLSYLPAGVQIVVALRPAALLEHPEGEKVRAALGPAGERAIRSINEATRVSLGDIEHLLCGSRAATDGTWQTTLVVRLREAGASKRVAESLAGSAKQEHGGQGYLVSGGRAYYLPEVADDKLLVVAPTDAISEIIELAGSPPPLRRDVERLLAHTDADRHVTLLVAPSFLFGEGRSMFSGPMARLRGPLFWFLGDELSAAAVSLHWDDNFFAELIATPTLDTPPQRAAMILARRAEQIPDRLEDYVVGLNAHLFGRRVIARFPGMVRKLATYLRSGFESDHATLRVYLPAVAGHNLLMGAELALMELPGTGRTAAEARSPADDPGGTAAFVEERLKRVTSLAFTRDTLEAALEQLSQDIGVEIVIVGTDLQADGITKNQSFGIDIRDKPAGEILVEILRLANPDKTATGPSDPRQKLVYVIASAAAGERERILVTTRAAAAERGDELPPVFATDEE